MDRKLPSARRAEVWPTECATAASVAAIAKRFLRFRCCSHRRRLLRLGSRHHRRTLQRSRPGTHPLGGWVLCASTSARAVLKSPLASTAMAIAGQGSGRLAGRYRRKARQRRCLARGSEQYTGQWAGRVELAATEIAPGCGSVSEEILEEKTRRRDAADSRRGCRGKRWKKSGLWSRTRQKHCPVVSVWPKTADEGVDRLTEEDTDRRERGDERSTMAGKENFRGEDPFVFCCPF